MNAPDPAADTPPEVATPLLPVVGIGASAGGLDALERLFNPLPPHTGAAYVVVQHLSSDHKSMMDALLSRHTAMPVSVATDGMPLQPDQVFLIPPGTTLTLEGSQLRLQPRNPHALPLPIDVFFESLAQQRGQQALAVVLSGTGSDGTRGAAAVNAAGGLVLVQSPQSARFDGMPRSAIAAGLADAVLDPDDLAARLAAHLRGVCPPEATDADPLPPPGPTSDEDAHAGIIHLLSHLGGIDFQDYKPGTVHRRIERRMAVCQCARAADYLQRLRQDRDELRTLRRELLIPVTRFFRDPDAFEALRTQVIDPLVAQRATGQPLRVWCAGVATGEEAYSVAMLFLEACDRAQRWPALKLFATDVEQTHVDLAAAGRYPESIDAEVPPELLERHFSHDGAQRVVRPTLRQCVVFARHDLLNDPPFTRMDLVLCRNTLIYFRGEAQLRVLRRLHYALAPKGALLLGSSEALGELEPDFAPLSAHHKLWRVLRPASQVAGASRATGQALRSAGSSSRRRANRAPEQADLEQPADRARALLTEAYAPPPALLLNVRHELVHAYGAVAPLVRLREGQASLEVAHLLPERLVPVAVALLQKARREGAVVRSGALTTTDPSVANPTVVRLAVWPLVGEQDEPAFLLVFEPIEPRDLALPAAGESGGLDVGAETLERLELLEHELAATRESLQASVEELETSNEELQATNEELMASNEELQSTNEELQSVNEELNTVNAEYREKIDILDRVNADLDSLTRVAASGAIFIDEAMQLTRFSPDAPRVFRLRSGDIGRPLGDLAHELDYPELIDDLRRCLQDSVLVEREAAASMGRRFLVKMLPYRLPSSSARGAVLSFVETTQVHRASRLQHIIDALAEHIAVLDLKGQIRLVNAAWCRFAAENGDPALLHCGPGTNYLHACSGASGTDDEGEARQAAEGVRAVLQGQALRFSMEYPCHSATEQRWFVMHVRPLVGDEPGAVVSHVDITPWMTRLAERRAND
jgi:two-component system CheB/CheR fusion protein